MLSDLDRVEFNKQYRAPLGYNTCCTFQNKRFETLDVDLYKINSALYQIIECVDTNAIRGTIDRGNTAVYPLIQTGHACHCSHSGLYNLNIIVERVSFDVQN